MGLDSESEYSRSIRKLAEEVAVLEKASDLILRSQRDVSLDHRQELVAEALPAVGHDICEVSNLVEKIVHRRRSEARADLARLLGRHLKNKEN